MEDTVSHGASVEVETLASLARLGDDLAAGLQTGNPQSHTTVLSVLAVFDNERWKIADVVSRVLNAPVEAEIEIIAVDDGSVDGSECLLQQLANNEPRLKIIRHDERRGWGAAIRTAISHMTGDVALIQDSDLEYDPINYAELIAPIVEGKADAVFGSRYAAGSRRVHSFTNQQLNRALTTVSNLLTDLNLSDMVTCHKAFKSDVLRQLRLSSCSKTIEAELTCRLAQWGARIYEVPIEYHGHSFFEGKKIRLLDGFRALVRMLKTRFIDPKFTEHTGLYVLKAMERADRYNRWVLRRCARFLGDRLLEAGAGIGNLSKQLLERERLVLVDYDQLYVERLRARFGHRSTVKVLQADLTREDCVDDWSNVEIDTIVCSNVLEHLEPDQQVLRAFHQTLVPNGHCLIVVPAIAALHNGLDEDLGHFRRYTRQGLRRKMEAVGFEIVYEHQFCKVGSVAWWFNGSLLRRRHLSPFQMRMFDRLWPLIQFFDRVLPWPGMSLAMVGRRRND